MTGRVDAALYAVEVAADQWAKAKVEELRLEDDRAREKSHAVMRLIGTDNPETGKPHSASSAEKVVELDEEYAAHRALQREATYQTIVTRAQYECALIRAKCIGANDETE